MDKHLSNNHLWFPMLLFILFTFFSFSYGQQEGCHYLIKTQTADVKDAGTNGRVRISLCTSRHNCFLVLPDLAQFGERGPLYSLYFERGSYSFFSVRTVASCSSTCQIILGHEGLGRRPHWLVDFVEVEAFNTWGTPTHNTLFPIYEWLNGTQVTVNRCLQDFGCNYEVWVRTGDQRYATTTGNVRLTLSDNDDQSVIDVPNLAQYGVKGPLATDYFAQRSHSLFIIPTESETCRNPCKASVNHNGDSWFLENIIVNIYNGTTFQYKQPFKFHQWIGFDEISTVDNCKHYSYDGEKEVKAFASDTLPQRHAIA